MSNGVIKSFDRRQGVGTVTPDDGSDDLSLHVSEVERAGLSQVKTGDHISFDRRYDATRRQFRAVNIGLIVGN